jgi:hypothetical protein
MFQVFDPGLQPDQALAGWRFLRKSQLTYLLVEV